jgi:hypothetical protein
MDNSCNLTIDVLHQTESLLAPDTRRLNDEGNEVNACDNVTVLQCLSQFGCYDAADPACIPKTELQHRNNTKMFLAREKKTEKQNKTSGVKSFTLKYELGLCAHSEQET